MACALPSPSCLSCGTACALPSHIFGGSVFGLSDSLFCSLSRVPSTNCFASRLPWVLALSSPLELNAGKSVVSFHKRRKEPSSFTAQNDSCSLGCSSFSSGFSLKKACSFFFHS